MKATPMQYLSLLLLIAVTVVILVLLPEHAPEPAKTPPVPALADTEYAALEFRPSGGDARLVPAVPAKADSVPS